MKIAIVGANGYIGKYLSNYLNIEDNEIIKYSSQGEDGIFYENGLLKDDFELEDDIDIVVYLSQSPYYRDMPDSAWHLFNVNQTSAIKLATQAINKNVKKFIYTSTGNVYKKSLEALDEESELNYKDFYALSKINAENGLMMLSDKIDIKIYRLFVVYGENQTDKLIPNIINSIKSGKEVILNRSDLNGEYDGLHMTLSYIENICDIIKQGIDKDIKESIFNINQDEILTLKDIIESISNKLGIEAKINLQENIRDINLISDNSKLKKYFDLSKFTNFTDNLDKII